MQTINGFLHNVEFSGRQPYRPMNGARRTTAGPPNDVRQPMSATVPCGPQSRCDYLESEVPGSMRSQRFPYKSRKTATVP